ncbi:MAG: response regulator transcription factor [Peptococcaceae bacterium]
MKRILIIEDDRDLNQGLCLALQNSAYQIVSCFDLQSGRRALAEQTVDLILLDINLPDGNGLTFLQELRKGSAVPVILLTANDTEMDVVIGLEHGADDYITKPFSLAILRARVSAQLRRAEQTDTAHNRIVLDRFVFDFDRMEFQKEGQLIELSKIEQKLLRLLVENKGVTLSRAMLVDRIWTDGAEYVDENALSVTIKRLRDKLDAASYIKTVYGVGYVWKDVGHDSH